jgi:hypothetical protein
MAKTDPNEKEQTLKGCYGEKVHYEQLDRFLQDVFQANRDQELANSDERFATCIWGHSGIGKTAKVKQHCKKPVLWNGKEYPGYAVFDVPIAQFEEMGDLHGMPSRHIKIAKAGKGEPEERWVPEEVLTGWQRDGWDIMPSGGVRTMYAPPDWVPSCEGPAILLLDDWNRASVRIIKGIMQLLQNYGMVSWKLPKGCNIVLTANPDEQDYLVTSLDAAILTRFRSITLTHDAKEWAIWAQGAGLDPRGINYVLRYPEMMIGSERTNPRTLAQCFRDMRRIPDLRSNENANRFKMMASSLLDDTTVSSLVVFMEREVEMIIEPEQILEGKDWPFITSHMEKLTSAREKRIDVLGVICDRLFGYIIQPTMIPTKEAIKNFQKFITMASIIEDLRYDICMRLCRIKDNSKTHQWIMHNDQLTKMIMSVI